MIYSLTSKEHIMYNKDGLWLMKTSSQYYYTRLQYYTKPNPIINSKNFFMVMYRVDGIYLWEFNETDQVYNPKNMVSDLQEHRRGVMNSDGIYVASGWGLCCTHIYDMRYYMKENQKIELMHQFLHSDMMYECFFESKQTAICCAKDGFLMSYDLNTYTESVLNKTELPSLMSCIQTSGGHIVAGSVQNLLILDMEGNLLQTHAFEGHNIRQIGEIRPNILITADDYSYSVHNITEVSAPLSFKQPVDNAFYMAVIPLQSNLGDFALGGRDGNTWTGQLFIMHMTENLSISTLKRKQNMGGMYCFIEVVKELYFGTIAFGGDNVCEELCLWNYISDSQPLCWADQTTNNIIDFLPVPIV